MVITMQHYYCYVNGQSSSLDNQYLFKQLECKVCIASASGHYSSMSVLDTESVHMLSAHVTRGFTMCVSVVPYKHNIMRIHNYWESTSGLFSPSPRLTIALSNINVRYNDRPFILLSGFMSSLIQLTGNNCFLYNNGTILNLYGGNTNLYFSRVNIAFINNSRSASYFTIDDPPIYIDSGTIQLEHSHVKFVKNPGEITAVDTNITFGDNVTIQFTNYCGPPNGGALSLKLMEGQQ